MMLAAWPHSLRKASGFPRAVGSLRLRLGGRAAKLFGTNRKGQAFPQGQRPSRRSQNFVGGKTISWSFATQREEIQIQAAILASYERMAASQLVGLDLLFDQ